MYKFINNVYKNFAFAKKVNTSQSKIYCLANERYGALRASIWKISSETMS